MLKFVFCCFIFGFKFIQFKMCSNQSFKELVVVSFSQCWKTNFSQNVYITSKHWSSFHSEFLVLFEFLKEKRRINMNSLLSNTVKFKDSNMRLNYGLVVTTRIFEGIKLDDIDIISILFNSGKSLVRNLINI